MFFTGWHHMKFTKRGDRGGGMEESGGLSKERRESTVYFSCILPNLFVYSTNIT
jgi:hypothetical protein